MPNRVQPRPLVRPLVRRLAPCCLALLAAAATAGLGGCASDGVSRGGGTFDTIEGQELAAGAFTADWVSRLKVTDGVEGLYPLGDDLVVLDGDNRAFSITQNGGRLNYLVRVAEDDERVFPPVAVQLDGEPAVAFPSVATAVVFDEDGRPVTRRQLDFAFSGPAASDGSRMYAGLSTPQGGQVGAVSPGADALPIQWRRLVFGLVTGKPALYEGITYTATGEVGGDRGRVYAIDTEGEAVWVRGDRPYVETFAGNSADVSADAFGVYVPSGDTQLYVYDRLNGRLKWRYYAGDALTQAAVPTGDRVYLPVDGEGLVALEKDGEEVIKQATWTAAGVTKFLGERGELVLGLKDDGRLVAVDRATGEERFTSDRGGFVDVVPATEDDGEMYAVTDGGAVVKVGINLTPGKIGRPL